MDDSDRTSVDRLVADIAPGLGSRGAGAPTGAQAKARKARAQGAHSARRRLTPARPAGLPPRHSTAGRGLSILHESTGLTDEDRATNRLRPQLTSSTLAITLALLLAGCGSVSPSAPVTIAPAPVASASPGAAASGQLHMTMEPPYDCCDLQLRYILADGTEIKGEKVRGDIEVIVNRPFDPGIVQVVYDGVTCEGSVVIASGVESDVVMRIGSQPTRCKLRTTETHAEGSVEHPELPQTAFVGADLPFGVPSVFLLRRLESPQAPPVAEINVDEAPWEVRHIEVTPGWFELSVSIDGERLGSERYELVRGSDWIFSLRFLPRDVARDCGAFSAVQCERAITAAYGGGVFLQGNTRVTSVTVRPTRYKAGACDSGIVPEYDLTFQLANPKGDVDATVGTPPNGRLTACTY